MKRISLVLAMGTALALGGEPASSDPGDILCDGPMVGEDCGTASMPVADYPHVFCIVPGDYAAPCPVSGPYVEQDANYSINPEQGTVVGDTWEEAVTGLAWTTAADLAPTLADAETVCETYAQSALEGRTDWRVPSLPEMGRILSRGTETSTSSWGPAFENPGGNRWWWTSTTYKLELARTVAFRGNHPWVVHPNADGSNAFYDPMHVFCVSGNSMSGAWEVDATGTVVTHTTTGLAWHQEPSLASDWADALSTCEGSTTGGSDDWRLPSIREALSVLDIYGGFGTSFTPSVFKEADDTVLAFLTSTPGRNEENQNGLFQKVSAYRERVANVSTAQTDDSGNIRCVRGPVAVPEPTAALLAATALGLVAALRRRPGPNEL